MTEVIALSALQGCVMAFDTPGRQSFVIQMVEDRHDLPNAIAINSTMVNLARFVGPALASWVIARAGEGWCFCIDGVSYLFVIASLAMMRIAVPTQPRSSTPLPQQLKDGWSYVSRSAAIRTILLLFAMVSLMGWPFMVLLPIFATRILHGNAQTYGELMGAVGVGSMMAALRMAVRRDTLGLSHTLATSALVFGLGLVAFGGVHVVWLSLVLMLVVGYGMMQSMSATNTLIQTIVAERMRGRVMGYYTMAFFGMAPFGSLLGGALAHAIGAPWTVLISGAATTMAALWFRTQRQAVQADVDASLAAHGEAER